MDARNALGLTSIILVVALGMLLTLAARDADKLDGKNLKPISADSSFVYVARFDASRGGMEDEINVTYIDDDGLLQQTRETDHDRLLELASSHRDTSKFFEDFPETDIENSSADRDVDTGIVYEGEGHRMRVAFQVQGDQVRSWTGATRELPLSIRSITFAVDSFMRDVPDKTGASETYIRARPLSSASAQRMSHNKILTILSKDALDSHEPLREAVEHPYRLVPVNQTDLSRKPFSEAVRPQRPLNLSTGDHAVQVRVLSPVDG